MDILVAFVVGVVVGVIVYIVAGLVPFLAEYAGLLGFLTFLLTAFLYFRSDRKL